MNQGEFDKAERLFLQEVKRDPMASVAWNQLGIIAFERGDMEQALEYFQTARGIAPLNPVYARNLAMVYAEKEKYEIAESLLTKSIELNPRDPDTYVTLAKVYLLAGEEQSALETLESTLRVDPAHVEALQMLEQLQIGGNLAEQPLSPSFE